MDNFSLNVREDINVDTIAQRLAEIYNVKGYTVTVTKFNNSVSVNFEKGLGGINTVLGMGVSVKANISVTNGVLNVTFSDAEWTSKIIGYAVGWFLCWIPIVTAVIGTINQLELPKSIGSDIRMIIN